MQFEEGKYVVVKPGRYTLQIVGAHSSYSKKSGNPVMNVKFVVLDEGEFIGAEIEKSLPGWQVCVLAKALGINAKEVNGKRVYDVDGVDLINRVVSCSITNREYEGKVYNDIGKDFVVPDVPAGYQEVVSGEDIPF